MRAPRLRRERPREDIPSRSVRGGRLNFGGATPQVALIVVLPTFPFFFHKLCEERRLVIVQHSLMYCQIWDYIRLNLYRSILNVYSPKTFLPESPIFFFENKLTVVSDAL